mmetsp:Transcript_36126/g.42255  ORF Transcript_36126/g.42255 Transcript_36126/m.42255 type:complete len:153 (+) Transcript_36126:73-531(+)
MKKKSIHSKFPFQRIKKIIQEDKEIGKVSHSIPFLIAKSLEMFLEEMIGKSAALAEKLESGKLGPSHLKKIVEDEEKFAFLADLFEDVEDLAEESKTTKKPKKSRSKAAKNDDDGNEERKEDSEVKDVPKKKVKKGKSKDTPFDREPDITID